MKKRLSFDCLETRVCLDGSGDPMQPRVGPLPDPTPANYADVIQAFYDGLKQDAINNTVGPTLGGWIGPILIK